MEIRRGQADKEVGRSLVLRGWRITRRWRRQVLKERLVEILNALFLRTRFFQKKVCEL